MSINLTFPNITMELYETDKYQLQKFISMTSKLKSNEVSNLSKNNDLSAVSVQVFGEYGESKKFTSNNSSLLFVNDNENKLTQDYFILYDFAQDCRYSKHIQPELIQYLLPFYYKVIKQAIQYGYGIKNYSYTENSEKMGKMAIDIYFQFNLALFFNAQNIKYAVGTKNYQSIMKYYIEQTVECMEMESSKMLNWISLFNTTIAFDKDNIEVFFKKIAEGSQKIKYSFFQYFSVLLFKESDNLLATNESKPFWTSDIWDFDDGYFGSTFFWSDDIIEILDKKIHRTQIEALLKEVKPILSNYLKPDIMELFCEEMKRSFDTGIFQKRKAEYLQKIKDKYGQCKYWDSCF